MLSWNGRKVALTGATGFLGHHVAQQLRQQGAEVVALVRQSSEVRRLLAGGVTCKVAGLDDIGALTAAMRGCEFVIHGAATVGFDNDSQAHYLVNVQGTRHVLHAARHAQVRRVVHISSIVAVGVSETPRAQDESARWNLSRYRVPYVSTKRWAEQEALAANGKDLQVVVVNPASVTGPDDFSGSEFGTLCRRFWKGRIPFHFGGGNNFVDVRDVAQGICLAAHHGRPGERYLLAGENRTYHAFFLDLCRAAQRTIPRFRLPTALARLFGLLNERWRRPSAKRPYLSSAQAALMGLYFFFDAAKARRELGYATRPLGQTLADTHAFWMAPAPLALGA